MNRAVWMLPAALAACSVSCAGRFDPAHFEGSREARRAEPEAIQELAARTDLLDILGRVHASCTARPGFRALTNDALSDVDCSGERLTWALRESAASAGGEALVGLHCGSRTSNRSSDAYLVECAADVARFQSAPFAGSAPLTPPSSVTAGVPAPSAGDVKRIDEPEASLAFRVLVTFEPAVSAFSGPARPASDVQELALLPITDRPLGDLSARCDGGCDERALRYGVLIAAGRLGAPDVVGVRCFDTSSGQSCVGTLAAPALTE
jgi:hypothetical protein